MSKYKNIIIYGTGGLGRGIVDLIHSINKHSSNKWNIFGFVDDNERRKEINGLKVLGGLNYLLDFQKDINVVLAFGSPKVKEKISKKLSTNTHIRFPNLIHPSVEFSSYNTIGRGNVISKGVSLSTNIVIGDFNLIHYNCSIGHDVSMGDYNSIFPLTALSGYVSLENSIEVGTNSAIIPSMTIGNHAVIGAGSTVIQHVRENTTVVGVPGRVIK